MRTFWDGSTCCVYGKYQFTSPMDCSITIASVHQQGSHKL